ncbi:MAG: hypothetical protein IEMM0002_0875 [bacterium]|nr:MAG: hypothetical protein IEMM0002_0875 [bacterium]
MKKREGGFTLIELVMTIVIMGIALPAILLPFVSYARGVGMPGKTATLAYVARGYMENEIARLGNIKTWPSLNSNSSIIENINGTQYNATVTRTFVTVDFLPADPSQPNGNRYLLIKIATSDESGNKVTLQTLKVRNYL